jgi:hypothetical protein
MLLLVPRDRPEQSSDFDRLQDWDLSERVIIFLNPLHIKTQGGTNKVVKLAAQSNAHALLNYMSSTLPQRKQSKGKILIPSGSR